ncbi:hypothetical protein ILUMI_09344 [Ignelater luminosus]|uniref:Uncharacterized protein n=1 Tax=Ignelater luminosus TaxID=2038154 RepID=A0A8K0GEM3_IGNLU|nr:hypothetical protein ILUMI_09344 [Ignelater luminosus]
MQKSNLEKPTSSHLISKNTNGSKSNICTCEPDKSSIISIVCRICYDGDKDEPIITPCRCRGTVAFVHRSCLETWLAESNTTSCELCHHVYRTERTPKYTARQSIWRWFRHQPLNIGFHVRGLRSDVLACAILTPLAIVITYVCLFSADYYNQKKFSNIPAAKWTSVSLLVMISIMLMGYYLWVYMVIRYHGRVWFYCWQRECVVRYIAPSSQNICCHHNINDYNEDTQYSSENQSAVSEDANYNDSANVHVPDTHDNIPIPEAIVTAKK